MFYLFNYPLQLLKKSISKITLQFGMSNEQFYLLFWHGDVYFIFYVCCSVFKMLGDKGGV